MVVLGQPSFLWTKGRDMEPKGIRIGGCPVAGICGQDLGEKELVPCKSTRKCAGSLQNCGQTESLAA